MPSLTTSDLNPTLDYALHLDSQDQLAHLRQEYLFPLTASGAPQLYFCGNSLGLQPKGAREAVVEEMEDWARYGVEGHFDARHPWYSYHEIFTEPAARIVGAHPGEVVIMNTLTTNLHLMMVSFYRPSQSRYKIVVEGGAFPSDQYAVASQVAFHRYNPTDAILELKPREGEATIRTEDIEELLQRRGEEIALVLLGGVNYYTGQAFEMERITAAAHEAGCVVGYDLAHAAGNLELKLHDWNADFAVWCTYKYLNSGPGAVGGCFVHERHAYEPELPRFSGWWGNEPGTRFTMPEKFAPQKGAAGWQLSNAQILPMAVHRVALNLFSQVGMSLLRSKSERMTHYLEQLLEGTPDSNYQILTPREASQRGCQLSIRIGDDAKKVAGELATRGIIVDYRHPDVIRVAPVPMYNSFEDVWHLADELGKVVKS